MNKRPQWVIGIYNVAPKAVELEAIEEPEPYQQFFDAFEKAMFLTAHSVE
jgi:hypothetical protein